jgi:hypothetical protein
MRIRHLNAEEVLEVVEAQELGNRNAELVDLRSDYLSWDLTGGEVTREVAENLYAELLYFGFVENVEVESLNDRELYRVIFDASAQVWA